MHFGMIKTDKGGVFNLHVGGKPVEIPEEIEIEGIEYGDEENFDREWNRTKNRLREKENP